MIIGVCGKSGSGKSTISCKIIELTKKQVLHLNIDKIGHDVLLIKDVKEELIKNPQLLNKFLGDKIESELYKVIKEE